MRRSRSRRRGVVLILVAVMLVALMGLVAFAVDIARAYMVRAQLSAAVDAGALAAMLKLKQDPGDVDAAVDAATEYVQLNRVGWLVTVPNDAITVEIGDWDADLRTFSSTTSKPNAVQVTGTQDEPFFFGRVLGQASLTLPQTAIASSGGDDVDVMMVLDLSGSMGSENRIEALRDAAPAFVNTVQEAGDSDRIGVMGYGAILGSYDPGASGHDGTVYDEAPSSLYPDDENDWVGVLEAEMTTDLEYLKNDVLTPSVLQADKYNGWTPIGAAIRDAAHYLETSGRPDVKHVIVLMSDGHANRPEDNGPGYAREMALYAESLGVDIHTIALGNSADEALMQDIAAATGGEYFDASGLATELSTRLEEAFRRAASTIKRTQLVK